jgi:hypothetical protein
MMYIALVQVIVVMCDHHVLPKQKGMICILACDAKLDNACLPTVIRDEMNFLSLIISFLGKGTA